MESFAQRLRTLREQRKVTQVEVAVAVGVERSTISKYETGGDIPGRDTLMKIAAFYNVTTDWLTAPLGAAFIKEGSAPISHDEALMLGAFRTLPKEEQTAHLNLLLSRAKAIKPAS